MKATALSFAFLVSVLSGCATRVVTETIVVPLAEQVPASLLTCRGRPTPGRTDRQSDVARYVVDLDLAGADCRSKVLAMRGLVEADAKINGAKP